MLFIDYSSAFNTIVPSKLVIKLEGLGLNPTLCNWVLDFLMGRPQGVKVGNKISTSMTLNTGAAQGCGSVPQGFSSLLYSLFNHDCVAMHDSNSIIKFADNTTVVGLITKNDETAYREEVRALGVWCQGNNLSLNINKTKEMIVDFRKQQREQTLIETKPSSAAPIPTKVRLVVVEVTVASYILNTRKIQVSSIYVKLDLLYTCSR